ncbi:MAG: ornithine cyclodeaminase family protein [Candidatus Limnocylindrales bacterium]
MSVLVLTDAEIERLLSVADCIPIMVSALTSLARGEAEQPLRLVVQPDRAPGFLAVMPAYVGGADAAFGLKAVGVFNGNVALGKDSHQGSVTLYDGMTGELLALMNASVITAIRTAAVSGVATKLLARADAGVLAIIGSGVEARTHLMAMSAVRTLREVRVAGRDAAKAQAFAEAMRSRVDAPIRVATSIEDAVRGADLVVTVTNSSEPVLRREWVADGAHINAVGAALRTTRELDSATVAASRLFVDRRESTQNESGDYLIPLADGVIKDDHIRGELGELLLGTVAGRGSDDEITLFKSLGLAVEDLATARWLFDRAKAEGVGTSVDF